MSYEKSQIRSLTLNPPGESLPKRALLLPARFVVYLLTRPDDRWMTNSLIPDSPDASVAKSFERHQEMQRRVYLADGISEQYIPPLGYTEQSWADYQKLVIKEVHQPPTEERS